MVGRPTRFTTLFPAPHVVLKPRLNSRTYWKRHGVGKRRQRSIFGHPLPLTSALTSPTSILVMALTQSSYRSALSVLVRLLFTSGFTSIAILVIRFPCVDFLPMMPSKSQQPTPEGAAIFAHAGYIVISARQGFCRFAKTRSTTCPGALSCPSECNFLHRRSGEFGRHDGSGMLRP